MAFYQLSVVDYLVFSSFLLLSVGVGVYYAIVDKFKKNTGGCKTEEYLMGGRKMSIIPVSLSLVTTFLSGITLLGTPAEVYDHGLLWCIHYLTGPIGFFITGAYLLPVLYRLNSTSIYEYLELRFHSALLRRLCAGLFIINTLIYTGVTIYAPALALNEVVNLDVWFLILLVGMCSTLYTTIGGLKAVVWADTLQAGVMYAGIFAIAYKGVVAVGGVDQVFDTFSKSGRWEESSKWDLNPAQVILSLPYPNPNPSLQYISVWIVLFSSTALNLCNYAINQMAAQRYCSLPSLRDAQKSLILIAPLYVFLSLLACFMAMVMFTLFYQCNPLETGEVSAYDQLAVLFAIRVSDGVPGLVGVFLACIFASSLSTVSSGYNSIAAVFYHDFVIPYSGHRLTPKKSLWLNKIVVLVSGTLSTGIAFSAGPLGGIVRSAVGLLGATIGPVLGVFCLGIFYRRASTKAVMTSFILSIKGSLEEEVLLRPVEISSLE
uniref:Sodium-dependent multivitamin transporter n=1 Tax=Steinernema glaseri TaxID=37863 RepID=A0A1I7ZX18_9BILA